MNDQLREEVRQHYAAAATRNGGCCGFDSTTGVMSLGSGDPLAAADLHPGRARARPGLGRGARRDPGGRAGRACRDRLGARHDRRDAGAGARERRRRRSPERALPQGRDRGGAAPGRERRRGDLELRDQPVHRQARGVPRAGAGAGARRTASRSATSSPRTGCRRPSAPSAAPTAAASPARSRSASTSSRSATRGSRTSRSSSPARAGEGMQLRRRSGRRSRLRLLQRARLSAVLDKAKTLTLPVINRIPDVTPAAQACCGVCRSCATTNVLTLAGGLVVACRRVPGRSRTSALSRCLVRLRRGRTGRRARRAPRRSAGRRGRPRASAGSRRRSPARASASGSSTPPRSGRRTSRRARSSRRSRSPPPHRRPACRWRRP